MITTRPSNPAAAEPAWDIARLFPAQGEWSEDDYFWFDSITGGRVEWSDGHVEVLPMPTLRHQLLLQWLFKALDGFVSSRSLGLVFVSGAPVRLRPGKVREPDVVFISNADPKRIQDKCLDGADLVMEIVSEDDPDRDYIHKRKDYAGAGVREYWIVDPRTERVELFNIPPGQTDYQKVGEYHRGGRIQSTVVNGFEIDVTAMFAATGVLPSNHK